MQKRFTVSYIRKKALFLALVIVFLSLSSCTKKNDSPIDIFDDNSSIPEASQMSIPITDIEVVDQVLQMNMPDFRTLNPLGINTASAGNLFSLIFEPAISVDNTGKCHANIIDDWTVSSNGLEYKFHVRKNVAFHDSKYGTVDADDLIYALEYIRDNDNAYMHEFFTNIEEVSKIDEMTFRIKTTVKKFNLLYLMSFNVIPKEYYTRLNDSCSLKPVGTGPYRVKSFSTEDKIVIERNSEWWKVGNVFSEIVFSKVDQADIRLGSSVFDDYDMIYSESFTAGSLGVPDKINLSKILTNKLYCLVPNVYNSLMSKESIRKAIAYAIDRNDIIESALNGLGEPTFAPLNDVFWAVDVEPSSIASLDRQKSKELLERAGYIVGDTRTIFTVNLLYCSKSTGYDLNKMIASKIAESLEKVNIKVNLIGKEEAEYRKALSSGSFQLALCEVEMDIDYDISDFLIDENYGNYFNAEISNQISKAKKSISDDEIVENFTGLQALLLDKMPIIGLFFEEDALLTDSNIVIPSKPVYSHIFANINTWKYIVTNE